jgi:prepilin-type N-terminal cleavage/methylation domain-containing protein
MQKRHGFTLTELMIALVIFGMLAVLSVPAFSKFLQTWRLNGEIDQLAGFLQRARSAAVTKNTTTIFKFKMSNGTYYYFEDDNANGVRDNNEYQSSIRELPTSIAFDTYSLSGPIVIFEPRGNANEDGAIVLKNQRQRTRQVSIFGGTGAIHVD